MTWEHFIETYLEGLRVRNQAPATVSAASYWLARFVEFCQHEGVRTPMEAASEHVEGFRKNLLWHVGNNGLLYSHSTVDQALRMVRGLFRWAASHQALLVDPTENLILPRVKVTPRRPLTVEEVERLLAVPDDTCPEGLRDLAVLETIYSTGIRRGECHAIDLVDLDLQARVLHVRGKGEHERYVPIGDALAVVLERYFRESRPRLLSGERKHLRPGVVFTPNAEAVFLSLNATRYSLASILGLVAHTAKRAGLGQLGPHQLRHACATHMLEGGADFHSIQQMLGHVNIGTTAIYAQVTARSLAEIHLLTHPRSRRQSHPRFHL